MDLLKAEIGSNYSLKNANNRDSVTAGEVY